MDEEIRVPEEENHHEEKVVEPAEITEQPAEVTVSATEIERLRSEARDNKEKYLHALAEGENSRKRLQKERQEMVQHAVQNVIVEFLNPIDQLENALKFAEQASPEVKNWVTGFHMILTQFKDVLTHHGISAFISEGHKFDPHFHEAIEMVVSEEHPPGTVVKEHLRGYKTSSGKVIRPARVHVSKAQENKETSQ